jgi:peptide/nickel transport system ATP-binding protein
MSRAGKSLLEVEGMEKHYPITKGVLKKQVGTVRAVDGINFTVRRGETVGIVGESGCGKSTTATSMLRLEEPTGGSVRFDGEDILGYDDAELKGFRRRAQMIFQDPSSSFDPRMSIGESVAEPLRIHGMSDRRKRRSIVEDLLDRVGLSPDDANRYPHEFSGGQKQRIAVARVLSVNPEFIVADEPVSALDVSIQAEILSLLESVQAEFGLSFLLISHDMGVIRQVCDRVNVMYLGEIVESGPTKEVFDAPEHPYTQALMSSIPQPDPRKRGQGIELTGDVPNPANPPSGCRFHTRCPKIIQPKGMELDQAAWREVMNLRSRLGQGGLDPEALVKSHFGSLEADESAPSPDDNVVVKAVRAEFDLPKKLGAPRADQAVEETLAAIASGNHEAARKQLAETFPTVCEQHHPERESLGNSRTTACFRHDAVEIPDDRSNASVGAVDVSDDN